MLITVRKVLLLLALNIYQNVVTLSQKNTSVPKQFLVQSQLLALEQSMGGLVG